MPDRCVSSAGGQHISSQTGRVRMVSSVPPFPKDGAVESRSVQPPRTAHLPASTGGAVIIPAHNEAGVIARTLGALAPLVAIEGIEVIVVCNGCTDGTAEIASAFAGVRVLETTEPSKTAALNLGDETATAWPRLYLDGDIEIDPQAVLAVFGALAQPGALAARARYVYDVTGASLPVRAYHRARSRIAAPPKRLWGAGGYAINERGHARFARFPDVVADDSWFDQQFDEDEKQVVPTAPMRVRTPKTAAELIAVLSRRRRGYLELEIQPAGAARARALLSSVRGPRTAFDAAWYAFVTLAARRRAQRTMRQGGHQWERDASSRTSRGGPA